MSGAERLRFRSGTVRTHVNHQTNAHAPNIIDDICHTGRWPFQNSISGVTSATRLGNMSAAPRNSAKNSARQFRLPSIAGSHYLPDIRRPDRR